MCRTHDLYQLFLILSSWDSCFLRSFVQFFLVHFACCNSLPMLATHSECLDSERRGSQKKTRRKKMKRSESENSNNNTRNVYCLSCILVFHLCMRQRMQLLSVWVCAYVVLWRLYPCPEYHHRHHLCIQIMCTLITITVKIAFIW